MVTWRFSGSMVSRSGWFISTVRCILTLFAPSYVESMFVGLQRWCKCSRKWLCRGAGWMSPITRQDTSEERILENLAAEIRSQADSSTERLDFDQLTALAPWSRRQIERRFRDKYLTSPARYFRDCQWDCARRLLLEGTDVLTASVRAGFASPGRLPDAVVVRSGFTPGEIRRRGAGEHLAYGFFETQIGIVMLAATKRGLC